MQQNDPHTHNQDISLTEEEIEHVYRVVDDSRAVTQEHVVRFARPSERDAVAKTIDPATATILIQYAETGDPYGEHDLDGGVKCIGREFFAVDPEDGIAIWIGDLPEEKRNLLRAKVAAADFERWSRLIRENHRSEESDASLE